MAGTEGKKRDPDFTPEEAERVRAVLRELRTKYEGGNAELGRKLGITGQALSQSLRADHPTVPRFDTARKAAKLAGYGIRVWEMVWPELGKGAAAPLSNFEIAAEVARREGWSEDAIEVVARHANLESPPGVLGPMHWIDSIRGQHNISSTTPANNQAPKRVQLKEDATPTDVPRPEAFGDRMRLMRTRLGWKVPQLATRSGVGKRLLEQLEKGEVPGTAETIEKIRTAFNVSAAWLGSPAEDAKAAKARGVR